MKARNHVLIGLALLLVGSISSRHPCRAAEEGPGAATVPKCEATGDGGPAAEATLCFPYAAVPSADGALYIVDRHNHRIRKIDPAGIITTVVGNGERGYSGDGGPATQAALNYPSGMALGPDGSLYIADTYNQRIRRVDPAGVITTVVGKGWPPGHSGDDGPAAEASLYYPTGVALGSDGSLYIADRGSHRIRKVRPVDGRVDPAGVITTIAGNGKSAYAGDGGPAAEAVLSWPFALAIDADGNLYIADQNNRRIRRIDTEGVITTIAGNGDWGYSGDGGPATEASLRTVYGLALAADGSLYLADTKNHRIRKIQPLDGRIDPEGVITTVAGNGERGYSGDGGPATAARLDSPCGVSLGADGSIYVADTNNHRIRKVSPDGIITTIAGGA